MLKLLKRVYSSKDIIMRLAFTDLKIKYAGSYLGIFWSLIEPLLIILVYSIIFPIVLKADFLEWFLFFICGLIPYRFTRKSITEMTTSLTEHSDILGKSQTAPEIAVFSKAVSNSVSFAIEISIITLIISIFIKLSIFILLLPIMFFINFVLNLGLGMYLSVLYPKMKDISYILGILFEAFFFLTPIVYRIDFIPSLYRGIYMLNPLTRLVYAYQSIFLHSSPAFVEYLSIPKELVLLFLFSLIVFIIGCRKFEKEKESSLELV